MTYSIVARDPKTGELGVAVQSRAFNTGAIVPWAAPGVGVVATQSYTEPSYGPLGLDLLRAGKTPEEALAELVAADAEREYRQVAILDGNGRVAVHVGEACIPAAGFAAGEGFSAQANMVDERGVWESMAESFERSEGPLADRLLDALDAAEAAGGVWRGRQAGGIIVVAAGGEPWAREVDVRVDDHDDPLGELRRLFVSARPTARCGGRRPRRGRSRGPARARPNPGADLRPDGDGQVAEARELFQPLWRPSRAGRTSCARSPTAGSCRTPPSCSRIEARQRQRHVGLGEVDLRPRARRAARRPLCRARRAPPRAELGRGERRGVSRARASGGSRLIPNRTRPRPRSLRRIRSAACC